MEVWEFQAETLHFILFQLIPDGVQALSSASVPDPKPRFPASRSGAAAAVGPAGELAGTRPLTCFPAFSKGE